MGGMWYGVNEESGFRFGFFLLNGGNVFGYYPWPFVWASSFRVGWICLTRYAERVTEDTMFL